MFKLKDNFVLAKIDANSKKVSNGKITIEQYLCDAIATNEHFDKPNKTGYNDLCKKIRKKRKSRKVKIMAEIINEQEVELVNDAFEKLSIPERIFFVLYNSTNYYDEEFGGKTYLNGELCWLLSFAKRDDKVKEYGHFIEENQYQPKAVCGMTKFRFNDENSFMIVRSKANRVLRNARIMQSTKELVNHLLKDPEEARTKYILAVESLAQTTDSDKVKLECYRVLGNWLGIDRPIAVVNNNLIFKGIESALASEDFDNLLEEGELDLENENESE